MFKLLKKKLCEKYPKKFLSSRKNWKGMQKMSNQGIYDFFLERMISNIINTMHYFDFWYAYYDSLFVESIPKYPPFSLFDFQVDKESWPSLSSPPELPQIFQALEKFIKTSQNWDVSSCTADELSKVQEGLNLLLFYLQIQKKYAIQFWKVSKRRIESSSSRIELYIQMFLNSIILYPNMTILSCKAALKLCANYKALESLMNDLKKKIQRLSTFFNNPYFNFQRKKIAQYFCNLNCLFREMLNIEKKYMCHHHKILSVIDCENRISIPQGKQKYETKRKNKMKKKCTKKSHFPLSDDEENLQKENFQRNIFEGNFYKIQKTSSFVSLKLQNESNDKIRQVPKIFKFDIDLENTSVRSPGRTLDSERVYQAKVNNSYLRKSNSVFEPNSKGPIYGSLKRNDTVSGKRKISTQFRAPAKTQEMMLLEKNNIIIMPPNEEKEEDRAMITNKPDGRKIIVKSGRNQRAENLFQLERKNESVVILESGVKISKGWQIIRNYVQNRIIQRKINRKLKQMRS